VRQHEIEHDDVEVFLEDELERFAAVAVVNV
jgi:hypothetical protein